LIGFPPGSK